MTSIVEERAPDAPPAPLHRVAERLRAIRPLHALAFFVVAEWIEVAAVAAKVRHAGLLYYQGGDQLWYYTLGWLFVHGHSFEPLVGYLWSFVLAPFALAGGPDILAAAPGVQLVDVLLLLPVALFALYGIATRIGGRVFAYWVLALWIAIPPLGILYTNTGYHQRYTELTLPQSFGLTLMADFPAMVATLVAVYFTARTLFDPHPRLLDALAAGAAAGAAIGIKPSASLFLLGPALALVATRRSAHIAVFAVAIVPALATLTLWKYRGYGHLPIFSSGAQAPVLLAAAAPPLASVFSHYGSLDWSHLSHEFDLLREHFWSGRVIQWSVVAGLIGLARRSGRAA
ncbi:MAG: hypothetical protein ACYDCH_05500, partial [Gaiellaceae bacterium]